VILTITHNHFMAITQVNLLASTHSL